jgi:type II secretory pathway component PulF
MADEPTNHAKTPAEIYSLASRSEQVVEAARLLEYGLREYSGDYRSGLTQLYNDNRKMFDKPHRENLRAAFEVRNQIRNVAKYGEPEFEKKTNAADAFVLAAQILFKNYPRIFPEKFHVVQGAAVADSTLSAGGQSNSASQPTVYEAARNKGKASNGELSVSGVAIQGLSGEDYVIPTYQLPSLTTGFKSKLRLKQLEKISLRLGTSLKAGISITRALESESRNLTGKIRESFADVLAQVSAGETLASSVSKHSCFPPLFCEMVRVGEETGRLDRVLLRLADHYRNLIQMRRTFLSGITWPLFQLGAAIGVISLFFIALSVLETMLNNFEAPDIFMMGLGPIGNLFLFWTLLVIGSGALWIIVKGISSGWFGELPMRLALQIPLIGNTIKILCLSRFSWSFGMAIETGMDATRAIRLGIRSTQNHYYGVHQDQVAQSVSQGSDFYTALDRTGAFPEDFLQAVEVGELTGELTESLERLSEDYTEQAELALKRISQISGMAIWLFITAILVFLIFLMYMNYIGILNNATGDILGTGRSVSAPEGPQDAQILIEKYTSGEKTSNPIIAVKNQQIKNILESQDFKKIQGMYEAIGNTEGLSGHKLLDKILEPFDEKN